METNSEGLIASIMDWFQTASPVIALVSAVISLILIVILLVLIGKQNSLKKRLDIFMMGENEISLEDTLVKVVEDNQKTKVQVKSNNQAIQ